MTEQEFNRIVSYMHSRFGIDLSRKRELVAGRLENELLQGGYESYTDYMDKAEADENGKEAVNLVNVLTTNHTYFMRESSHFAYFKQVVLPQLRQREAASKDLRIWSAASSTGEEPYTLAMILMDYFGDEHVRWDTKILATDLSGRVLQQAKRGIYQKEQIKPLPAEWQERYFKRVSDKEYEVTDALKNEVIYRRFNLMHPFCFRKKFHVVFLRNVMLYFDEEVRRNLLCKIYDCLEPGGYLFIGTTEGLDESPAKFRFVQSSVYQKVE